MKKYLLALLIATVTFVAFTISPAKAVGGPPYFFKFYGQSHYCIGDPNDSTTDGTHALLEVCNVNTPGEGVWFVNMGIPGVWWIKTDNGMCITDQTGNGVAIVYDACNGTNGHQGWSYAQDVNGHDIWANGSPTAWAIGLKNSNPFSGAIIQSESAHLPPLPADTDQEWCVTDANNQPLVCA